MIAEPLQMIVAAAHPGATPAPGFTKEQIAAAEQRLGVVLPEPLKDFFAAIGGSPDLMGVDYRMLPPEKLRVDGTHLIFCAENQGLEEFGIPLEEVKAAEENPNVDVRPKNAVKWFGEAGSLSAFLLGMTAWQAVLSLPEKGRCPFPQKQLKKLLAFFEPVGGPDVRIGAHRFGLVDRTNGIVAAYLYNTESLYVGSSRDAALEALEKKSRLDFESL